MLGLRCLILKQATGSSRSFGFGSTGPQLRPRSTPTGGSTAFISVLAGIASGVYVFGPLFEPPSASGAAGTAGTPDMPSPPGNEVTKGHAHESQ